jgi:hypothetical protein
LERQYTTTRKIITKQEGREMVFVTTMRILLANCSTEGCPTPPGAINRPLRDAASLPLALLEGFVVDFILTSSILPTPGSMPRRRRPTASRRSEDGGRANGLLARLGYRGHLCTGQQRGEPRFIEQYLLAGRLPEGADLPFMDVSFPDVVQKHSDGKEWEVQMPPWNVTLCPVTLNTMTSIL